MSDEAITGQQAGQPETIPAEASQQGQPAPENASPQYVTEQQLADFEKRILSQTQSLVDKKGNAINAKIAQLQKAGISVTPEQARTLIDQEEASAQRVEQTAKAAQPDPVMPAAVDPEKAEWIKAHTGDDKNVADPIWGQIYAISKSAGGMLIEKDDPEFELVNKQYAADQGDAFVADFTLAIASKRLRLSNNKSQGYASIPALFSGGQKSNSVPDDISPKDLYAQAFV